jgi:hypothetical protein
VFLTVFVSAAATSAFAQGATVTASITGTVVDRDQGVVPGATVEAKNNATAVVRTAVTNSSGAYSFPAMELGTYTVTVSLSGFKTFVHTEVRLQAGTVANLRATLEVGQLTEQVNVKAASELVQTTQTTVSNTVSMETIANLPVVTRNALNFVTFLPGVETPGTGRASTINGLPQSAINISIDGVSTSNLLQSGDGFYSMVFPRLDAVQEVTVSGAGAGAADAGGGAVQIKFVTRSGTNQFDTSIYHYWRDPRFNTNYFFNEVNNLDKNRVIVHQYGFRVGGPIVIPGVIDGRGKAFFFSNFEHFYQPTEITRTRTILTPEAEAGLFQWTSGGVLRSQNVLALAAANGQITATDPIITALLAKIRQGTTTTGNINPINNAFNQLSYIYQAASTRNEKSPTNSVDVNLTPTNRIKGTYYIQRFTSNPDILNGGETRFPGLQNFSTQDSWRTTGSVTLRSTMGSGLVYEVLGGWQSSPVEFGPRISPAQFEEQGGYSLGLPLTTAATTSNSIQPRNTVNWNIDNTLSWLKGPHSFAFGGSFLQITHNQHSSNAVPTVNIGFDNTNDPARGLFSTANFPGASSGNLSDARALYGLLTGRVTSINGTARLNAAGDEYVYLGDLFQRDRMNMFSAYAQDSWRLRSNLTINAGVRWEVLFPPYPLLATRTTSTFEDICGESGFGSGPGGRACNMFNPGVFNNPGHVSQYDLYDPGSPGFETKYFDFGPNIGAAWRPNVQDGFWRKILGDPDQATVRAVFSMTFNRPRMDAYTGVFGGNPGATPAGGANRSTSATAAGPLYYPGEPIPLLFSEKNRLGPPAFQKTPAYPIIATPGDSFSMFDPEIVTPRTNSWSFGLQRSVGRDMAVEVRYVGNRNYNGWTEEDWNQLNIFENNFLPEFELAQKNLLANVQAGRGGTFAYMGEGTGTYPLPIYLAHLQGLPASAAGIAANYTSTNFTNGTLTGQLDPYFANPRSAAGSLWDTASFRTNMANAGLPSNFWVMNPFADSAAVTVSKSGGHYHSIVLELRRRLSRGLHAQVNYTHARSWGSSNQDLHRDRLYLQSANVPHAFKTTFAYEIPVGRGKRFGTDMNKYLNAVVGNWDVNGTGRIQWRLFNFRGKVVGMSVDELQDNFKIRYANSPTGLLQVFLMPQDIIDETRKAYNTDETSPTGYSGDGPPSGRYQAPAGGPGCIILYTYDCGQQDTWILGPSFVRFDLTFKKRFPFGRRASFDIQVDMLNAFDNINFTQSFNPGSGGGIFQVTSAYTDVNGTFDPGGRLGQIVWRLNF